MRARHTVTLAAGLAAVAVAASAGATTVRQCPNAAGYVGVVPAAFNGPNDTLLPGNEYEPLTNIRANGSLTCAQADRAAATMATWLAGREHKAAVMFVWVVVDKTLTVDGTPWQFVTSPLNGSGPYGAYEGWGQFTVQHGEKKEHVCQDGQCGEMTVPVLTTGTVTWTFGEPFFRKV